MATLTKQWTFAASTTAESAKVNTNFDDIVAFCNGSLVHLDGSKTMTGNLTLNAADPASDNQAARKLYVDKQSLGGRPYVFSHSLDGGMQTSYAVVGNNVGVVTPTYNYWLYVKVFGRVGFGTNDNLVNFRILDASSTSFEIPDTGEDYGVHCTAGKWHSYAFAGLLAKNAGQVAGYSFEYKVSVGNTYVRAAVEVCILPRV